MALLVFTWMCGVLLLSLRLASGWLWVQAMKRHRASPAADTWQYTARKLARQLHIGRPVRLLESGEARGILLHYEEEPEFRAQVNRYIADFETMLRAVLASSGGNAVAITLLSSDMGKLYVALAQAIARLRQ